MKAVILIHGVLTNIHDFDTLVPLLKKEYDKIAYVKIPGHNNQVNFKLFNKKDTFCEVIKTYDNISLKYDTIDLVGYSMGGALASYLCTIRKINKVVFVAPANKHLNFRSFFSKFRYLFVEKSTSIGGYIKDLGFHIFNLFTDEQKIANIYLRNKKNYNIRNYKVFLSIINKVNQDLIKISTKALILWGDVDNLVPKASISFLEQICDDSTTKIYKGLSHLLLKGHESDFVLYDIIDFLKE